MSTPDSAPKAEDFTADRPFVFRNAIVITVDSPGVLDDADVLVRGETIEAVGPHLEVPEGTLEIDARGGILTPGFIDSHRHMWQTALRGYGGDWALSQYFVFYYLQWGQVFRPEDVYAGNLLSALESVDTGVTTTLDWSHGLRNPEYGEAALQAFREIPGRFVLGYGNYLGAPWEWANAPEFRRFVTDNFNAPNDMLGLQLAFDVPGAAEFPERGAFEAARELGLRVTTHAGVWGATTDTAITQMYDAGFMTPEICYVHASSLNEQSYQKIAATGGTVSVATESEQSAGQGYPSSWAIRRYGIPASISMDTSVWWSADFFSAMRATLSADRSRDHLEAHARNETIVANRLRAEDVVHMATMGGAKSLGMEDTIGSITPGQEGRSAAHQERRVAGDDADPQSVRPCRLPGGHRRRAHRRRQRQGRQVRRSADRAAVGSGRREGGAIGRLRALAARRRRVERGDAPRTADRRGDREPVHLHGGRRPRHGGVGRLMILHLALFTWKEDVTADDVAELTSQLREMASQACLRCAATTAARICGCAPATPTSRSRPSSTTRPAWPRTSTPTHITPSTTANSAG